MTASTPRRLLGFACKCGGEVEVVDAPSTNRRLLVKERCTSCGRESLPEKVKTWERRHARAQAARAAARGDAA